MLQQSAVPTAHSSRGPGRVVPRTKQQQLDPLSTVPLAAEDGRGLQAAPHANQESSSSQPLDPVLAAATTATTAGPNSAAETGAASGSSVAPADTANWPPQTTPTAPPLPGTSPQPASTTDATAVVAAGAASKHLLGPWRCDPAFEGAAPAVLWPKDLFTGAAHRLLSSGQPVVLRSVFLADCKLQLGPDISPSPGSSGGGGGSGDSSSFQDARQAAGNSNPAAAATATPPIPAAATGAATPSPSAPSAAACVVLCSPAGTHRFIECDAAKNVPGGYYHLRRPETSRLSLSLPEAVTCSQSWSKSMLLIKAQVGGWVLPQLPDPLAAWLTPQSPSIPVPPADSDRAKQQQARAAASGPAEFRPDASTWPELQRLLQPRTGPAATATAGNDLPSGATAAAAAAATGHALLDWKLLQHLTSAGRWEAAGQLQFELGQAHCLQPARYSLEDRLICQVSGCRRVLLLPPSAAFRGLYPYPVAHPYDTYSCVDLEEPEAEHWKHALEVKGLVCDLHPGDALLVPAYYWLHSELLQPNSCSLIVKLQPGPRRLLSKGALLLQLSRMIEVQAAAELAGAATVRKWLLAMAQWREWERLQLCSLQGYRRIRLAASILQQLQMVLGLPSEPQDAFLAWLHQQQQQQQETGANAVASAAATATAAAALRKETPQSSSGPAAGTAALPPGAACSSDSRRVPGQQQAAAGLPAVPSTLEVMARQLLGCMCEERLIPTPWLNEGIDDPLYLSHPPEYYLLEEDAEAAAYPQLFRHRLISSREDWKQQAKRIEGPSAAARHEQAARALLPGAASQQQQQPPLPPADEGAPGGN